MWSEIIIHLSRMNLILNWKMGSSLHFDSSTFLYILCQRQNLIVDSILRFIQYPLYVQWAIGLVELCPKTIKVKIYIDLPLSYLDRKFNSKAGLFPYFVKSARSQVPKHRHRRNVTSYHSFSLLWLFSVLWQFSLLWQYSLLWLFSLFWLFSLLWLFSLHWLS